MAQMRLWAKNASRAAASVLFPDTCLACSGQVSQQGVLCPTCWHKVSFIDEPMCAVTGMPFSHDFGKGMISAQALADPPPYEKARSVAVHAGVTQKLVQRLKYGDRTDLARWMAQWMVRAGKLVIDQSEIVVPVPLHRWRFFTRRYNQSAELARALAQTTGLPFKPEVLVRKRATQSQVGLTADQRNRNVQGAFLVRPEHEISVAGRNILLVDDVLTTGATVNACTRALKRAGAAKVNVLTFSRVVPGHLSNDRQFG